MYFWSKIQFETVYFALVKARVYLTFVRYF